MTNATPLPEGPFNIDCFPVYTGNHPDVYGQSTTTFRARPAPHRAGPPITKRAPRATLVRLLQVFDDASSTT